MLNEEWVLNLRALSTEQLLELLQMQLEGGADSEEIEVTKLALERK